MFFQKVHLVYFLRVFGDLLECWGHALIWGEQKERLLHSNPPPTLLGSVKNQSVSYKLTALTLERMIKYCVRPLRHSDRGFRLDPGQVRKEK